MSKTDKRGRICRTLDGKEEEEIETINERVSERGCRVRRKRVWSEEGREEKNEVELEKSERRIAINGHHNIICARFAFLLSSECRQYLSMPVTLNCIPFNVSRSLSLEY